MADWLTEWFYVAVASAKIRRTLLAAVVAPGVDWVDLKPGEYIRGCLTREGVYAITTTSIRVLRASGLG